MFESCLFFNLNSLTRLLNKQWEDAFAPLGLSASHGYLLRAVLAHPGSTQKQLAEQLDLAPSTVTRFLEVLEQKGFVVKTCCDQDGRAMTVEATKKGLALEAELSSISEKMSGLCAEGMAPGTSDELVKMLRACRVELLRSHQTGLLANLDGSRVDGRRGSSNDRK